MRPVFIRFVDKKRSIHERVVDGGIQFGRLTFPVFIDILRRFLVGNDEFEFEHRLHGRENL